jgi:hypothetical protein
MAVCLEQIDDILADHNRVIEKSRAPLVESERKRLRLGGAEEEQEHDCDEEEAYDLEVYDDRHFYSQMLKVGGKMRRRVVIVM